MDNDKDPMMSDPEFTGDNADNAGKVQPTTSGETSEKTSGAEQGMATWERIAQCIHHGIFTGAEILDVLAAATPPPRLHTLSEPTLQSDSSRTPCTPQRSAPLRSGHRSVTLS